jgi:hypothetical protein
MNYVLYSQKSHVEFFLAYMLSLGVTLPLPKYAKLCSGMRHEEYADEAPLLKVVI